MNNYCLSRVPSRTRIMLLVAVVAGLMITASAARAQQYSYLPTASTTDGRFFSVAGTGIQTLGDNPLVFKIAARANMSSLELGVFDGETGGTWDQGSTPLVYTLYADPAGDGSGQVQLAQWSGSVMTDNTWYAMSVPNSSEARCGSGDYFYVLRVSSSDLNVTHWSSFKLRTNGTIVVKRETNLAYTAPLGKAEDAAVIYPSYPALAPTTYDGTWNFYMDVPVALASLALWDGDMDYGSYDCSINDDNDPDTPDDALPGWASALATAEAVAVSNVPCQSLAGSPTGGTATSNPPDDSRNPVFRREPSVQYELIAPDGQHYTNANPSGNLEWEQFMVSTAAFNRGVMDAHAAALPAGTYQVHVRGVDLSNLNAIRFPYDVTGVDASGQPVIPVRPDFNDGIISGVIYYETNSNTVQDGSEPGIPSITVHLAADFNSDGVVDATMSTETSAGGEYTFAGLHKGSYVVTVDPGTLAEDAIPVWDTDDLTTSNMVSGSLAMCARTSTMTFAYKRTAAVGTRTRGYWVNHPDNWPVTSLKLGNVTYTKAELIGILERPTRGDKTYALAAQLIATKLNLADGCESSCITQTVTDADAWLTQYALGSNVKNNPVGDALQKRLDDYNNGRLCVGHMN